MAHLRTLTVVIGVVALLCMSALLGEPARLTTYAGRLGWSVAPRRPGTLRRLQSDVHGNGNASFALNGTSATNATLHLLDGATALPDQEPSSAGNAGNASLEVAGSLGSDMLVQTMLGAQGGARATATLAGCPLLNFDQSRTPSGAARCFCQLAGNPTCSNSGCHCGETCSKNIQRHGAAATFVNMKSAAGCAATDGLLTVPRSFYRDIRMLRDSCGDPTHLLTAMLQQSFAAYQSWAAQGSVMQCIHASATVSVPWLHLHTFCDHGHLDGMPTSHDIALCMTMHNYGDASNLAQQFLRWAH